MLETHFVPLGQWHVCQSLLFTTLSRGNKNCEKTFHLGKVLAQPKCVALICPQNLKEKKKNPFSSLLVLLPLLKCALVKGCGDCGVGVIATQAQLPTPAVVKDRREVFLYLGWEGLLSFAS